MIFSCFHWEFHIYRNDIPKSKKEQGNSKRGVGGKSRSRIDLRNPRFKPSDNKSIFWGFLSINWHSCPRKLSFFFSLHLTSTWRNTERGADRSMVIVSVWLFQWSWLRECGNWDERWVFVGTMNGGSLGMRSGSYGSLLQQQQQQQQLQNGGLLPVQATPLPPPLPGYSLGRKPPKMVKEKERFVHWICKFAGRKKVGMLLLCVVSAAVFVWVLYVGKGLIAPTWLLWLLTVVVVLLIGYWIWILLFFPCATVVFEFRVICFWIVQRWNLNSQTLFDLLVLSRIEWF